MPLTIPYTFTAETVADATQINADLQAVAAKELPLSEHHDWSAHLWQNGTPGGRWTGGCIRLAVDPRLS